MTLRFRASKLLLTIATLFVCGLALVPNTLAQALPKKTARVPETNPASSSARREHRRQVRAAIPVTVKTPASVESNNFIHLADNFTEQKKWKAAEAAYKEAINVWPGNVDALLQLGYLYIDRNKLDDARQTYNKLRPLSASAAADLLAEINILKTTLAH